MSSYDIVTADFPLPDGFKPDIHSELQTKDLECNLQHVRIGWSGLFIDINSGPIFVDPEEPGPRLPHWQRIVYTGQFYFKAHGDHRYVAAFDRGTLMELRMAAKE